ncbi:hypothetical protein JTB14_011128 [Gonioctena quinquepunctata]|nr:hypothetical protein JTB14_011128 [Gonioctena quinquepunctata]
MERENEEQLLKWPDASSDEEYLNNVTSDHGPFSTDDSLNDTEYVQGSEGGTIVVRVKSFVAVMKLQVVPVQVKVKVKTFAINFDI